MTSNRGRFPEITDAVGYWLAGFVDGEGHFGIVRQTKKTTGTVSFGCLLMVKIRDDDTFALERIHELVGVGALYNSGPRATAELDNKPVAIWQVSRKDDCLRLVEIFERYPLWTTKAQDFHIWAKAVRYMQGPRPEGNAPLEHWFHEIREVRAYVPRTSPLSSYEVAVPTLFDELDDDA